jgi:hypothetical protein
MGPMPARLLNVIECRLIATLSFISRAFAIAASSVKHADEAVVVLHPETNQARISP